MYKKFSLFLFLVSFLIGDIGFSAGIRKKITAETEKDLITVMESYKVLYESFLRDDGQAIEAAASKLKLKMELVKDTEISKILIFGRKKLADTKVANKKELNLKNFQLVSMALVYLVHTYKIPGTYNEYSCKDSQKKWVQDSKKTLKAVNPFDPKGSCGEKISDYQ